MLVLGAVNCLKLGFELVNMVSPKKDIFFLIFPSILPPPNLRAIFLASKCIEKVLKKIMARDEAVKKIWVFLFICLL